jgi:hypothetical protein
VLAHEPQQTALVIIISRANAKLCGTNIDWLSLQMRERGYGVYG